VHYFQTQILDSIRRLKSQLSDIIEPDFGLLEQLLGLEVLTPRQYDDICSETRAAYRRSAAILDLLLTEDQCQTFLTALKLTEQQHIINFIKQNRGKNYDTIIGNGIHRFGFYPGRTFLVVLLTISDTKGGINVDG